MDIISYQEARKAQERIGKLLDLDTNTQEDIVAAINELVLEIYTLKEDRDLLFELIGTPIETSIEFLTVDEGKYIQEDSLITNFVGDIIQLEIIPPFADIQTFDNDTGFIYNAPTTEFSGGRIQLILPSTLTAQEVVFPAVSSLNYCGIDSIVIDSIAEDDSYTEIEIMVDDGVLGDGTLSYYDLDNGVTSVSVFSEDPLQLEVGRVSNYIRYALSFDGGTTYKTRSGGVWIDVVDIHNEGMLKSEIEALTFTEFSDIYNRGTVVVKASIKSNINTTSPYIESFTINLSESCVEASHYVLTGDDVQIYTADWKILNRVIIDQTEVEGSTIKYAFSFDGRASWKVFDAGWNNILLSELDLYGMVKSEVEALERFNWDDVLTNSLDIAVFITSTSLLPNPSINTITFNYNV